MFDRLVHRVSLPDPRTHLVHVESVLSAGAGLPPELVLAMPVWSPGSYLVREYARHVEGFSAEAPARARKIRKNAWRVETSGAARVVVRYRAYAGELTVRTSHVDETHAFLVGAALFLYVEGQEALGARVEIAPPRGWRAATALARAAEGSRPGGPLAFEAPSFDALVDSPIELGTHAELAFEVLGKPHRYAFWPRDAVSDADARRLADDTKTILETEARLFDGALPYGAYDLLLHVYPRGRGGLEHRDSAAFIVSPGAFATREAYLDTLSLVAHEVFHAWNVKRIRPAGLTPYRYDGECYTRLLWWFEGATSYYDWRVLLLARLCKLEEYLDHLAGEIAYLDQTPGRRLHPLEETSFDAWIKLYRPDENFANSSVSYYRKGELVCALLDIEIRTRSRGAASLDDVLRRLWTEYGLRERPVPEDGMQPIFEEATGVPLGDLFDAWIRSGDDIDYGVTFAKAGLTLERSVRPDAPPCSLGVRLRSDAGRTFVAAVNRDGAAARGGIDAGDELLAVAGVRVEGSSLDAALRGRAEGSIVEVTVAREGRVVSRPVTLDPARPERVKLLVDRHAPTLARETLIAWLGET